MRWNLPAGTIPPQTSILGGPIEVEEADRVPALDLIDNARSIDAARQFEGRIVIIGSSAEDLGDIYLTSVGVMPGLFVIANGLRSALEAGPVFENNGYFWGLIVTVVMTVITFFLWLLVRELPAYRVPVFKFGALAFSTVLWFVLASWALASGQVIEFIFPQYLVSAYLVFATSWLEAL